MNSSSRRTYSSPIRTICVPHTEQICSSSGSTTFSNFRPLKQSSFTGMVPVHRFFQQGWDPISFLLQRRDSVVPESHRIFFPWRNQRVFGSDNTSVPGVLSRDQIKALSPSRLLPQKRKSALDEGFILSWSSITAQNPRIDFRKSV